MQKIQILASHLIDQIAAGEVIERPASVVKELVENAIDAAATKILIRVQNAGRSLIQIIDNGEGMHPQDCLLAVQRHATSKLKVIEDIYQLNTMGFRGEALAAIASISELEITTNQDEATAGFFVRVSNGKMQESGKIGFAKGTKVVARNIFQSIPARLKFLKSNATELQKIKDKVFCFGLIHHKIEFHLLEDEKTIFHFPARNLLADRVRDLLGKHHTKNLFFLEYQESYINFQGFFSLPEFCRVNKRLQFEYINRRHIQSTQLNRAVYKGYEGMLMKQLHPIYILYITINPSEVDVNVHPAKTQVQLKNHILVQTIISQQISTSIRKKTRQHHGLSQNHSLSKENFLTKKNFPSAERDNYAIKENKRLFSNVSYEKPAETSATKPPTNSFSNNEGYFSIPQKNFLVNDDIGNHLEKDHKILTGEKEEFYINILGVYKKYLFAQINNRLAMIDVHAAHERIRFEEIKQNFLQSYSQETTSLLTPFVIKFSSYEHGKVLENLALFQEKGLTLKQTTNGFLVQSLPSALQEVKNQEQTMKNFILEVLDEKENFQNTGNIQEVVNAKLQRKSCHSAIRGIEQVAQMSLAEMQQLVKQICQNEMIIYCPHGRPIILFYDENDLDKLFQRR